MTARRAIESRRSRQGLAEGGMVAGALIEAWTGQNHG